VTISNVEYRRKLCGLKPGLQEETIAITLTVSSDRHLPIRLSQANREEAATFPILSKTQFAGIVEIYGL
jgi:hypothetical protein